MPQNNYISEAILFYTMKFLSSIKKKILLLLLIFGIIPTLIFSTYFYYSLKDTLVYKASKQLTSLRINKKQQIEDFFKNRVSEVKLFANSDEIKGLFSEYLAGIGKTNSNHILKLLQSSSFTNAEFIKYLLQVGYYSYFALTNNEIFIEGYVDKKNNEINNISLNNLFNSKLESLWIRSSIWKRTIIQDFNLNKDVDSQLLYLAGPLVNSNGKFVGMFVLGVPQNTFQNLLRDGDSDISIFQTEETYIAGRDYSIRSSSRTDIENISNKKVPTNNVWDAFSYSNLVKQMDKYDGSEVIASLGIMKIPFLNWSIISSVRLDEVLKPIYAIQEKVIMFLIILAMLLFLFAYFIARRFTEPLLELQSAVEDVSEGSFNSIINVKTNDEIGKLSNSFNKMVIELKESTEKLKEREKRLFHFYSATNDGIVLHKENKPLLINRTLAKITGHSRVDLLKMKVDSLFTKERAGINNESDSLIFETKLYLNNGSAIPVEVQEKNLEYNGETVRASVIRDISRRKKIEQELDIEKNKHLTSLLDGQELERQRLSRELHDGLGQSLIALQLRLQNILNSDRIDTEFSINEAIISLDKTIEEIRRMSNDLMPAILNQFGLSEALNKLCANINKYSKSRIEYLGKPLTKKLASRTIIYLYRIAQEAISNIIKYSKAENAVVKLEEKDTSLILSIFDNGIGIDKRIRKEGNGIFNMQERTKLLNGKFIINSAPDLGTKIIIEIPLN